MASPTLDRETILQSISGWTPEDQLELAQEITRRVITSAQAATRNHASFEDARGLLAIPGKPAPTDEDIERIRMEKYDE